MFGKKIRRILLEKEAWNYPLAHRVALCFDADCPALAGPHSASFDSLAPKMRHPAEIL